VEVVGDAESALLEGGTVTVQLGPAEPEPQEGLIELEAGTVTVQLGPELQGVVLLLLLLLA